MWYLQVGVLGVGLVATACLPPVIINTTIFRQVSHFAPYHDPYHNPTLVEFLTDDETNLFVSLMMKQTYPTLT